MGRRIEKIVDAIALMAVQTSMLAVSGSVEAARAGDAGRGFAVVSNDIRSLAREASQNVERAKDTVLGILDQIATLKRDLEQVAANAETEIQGNRAVFAALDKVDVDMTALSVANQAILEGAEIILASVAEASGGARQIAAAAEQARQRLSPGRGGLDRTGAGRRRSGGGDRGDRVSRRRTEAAGMTSAAIAEVSGSVKRRFLVFQLAERVYALAAETVAEVIRIPTTARVPQAPRALIGVANLRGAVLPVVSLRALLGLEGEPGGSIARGRPGWRRDRGRCGGCARYN